MHPSGGDENTISSIHSLTRRRIPFPPHPPPRTRCAVDSLTWELTRCSMCFFAGWLAHSGCTGVTRAGGVVGAVLCPSGAEVTGGGSRCTFASSAVPLWQPRIPWTFARMLVTVLAPSVPLRSLAALRARLRRRIKGDDPPTPALRTVLASNEPPPRAPLARTRRTAAARSATHRACRAAANRAAARAVEFRPRVSLACAATASAPRRPRVNDAPRPARLRYTYRLEGVGRRGSTVPVGHAVFRHGRRVYRTTSFPLLPAAPPS